jgi:LytS/YehU family sensor histidine kinase
MEDEKEQAVLVHHQPLAGGPLPAAKHEQLVIPLAKDLEFIRAYVDLLKTRFENGLVLKIDVVPEMWPTVYPADGADAGRNAVKHNRLSAACR